ncbi:hypothetical protein POM88_008435 [Heracleum sosnowskyi]|uniref:Uncharacterized protein n=1 Tax=Heracleum sosnowskyi TaxID=360622 RepID=A0AAD8J6D9_9APIA|nr:hypothetical protein POM88_008435 [Heracleum sosnowskyi]
MLPTAFSLIMLKSRPEDCRVHWDLLPPKKIKDLEAKKGYDDIPKKIQDVNAKKPVDWYDEDDGEETSWYKFSLKSTLHRQRNINAGLSLKEHLQCFTEIHRVSANLNNIMSSITTSKPGDTLWALELY